jgi:hypothetical protein
MTLGVITALVIYAPTFASLRVGTMYEDIDGFDPTKSLNAEANPALERFMPGDGIVFRLWQPTTDNPDAFLGWVVGFPGDEIRVQGGKILVNGKSASRGADVDLPAAGPLIVPAHHVFVTSSRHMYDSIAFGPIPQAAILGRVKDLP